MLVLGYYLYMDSSVGHWGYAAMILSEIFTPESRGHCFTFWYHMYGNSVGTLNLHINNRYRENNTNKAPLCTQDVYLRNVINLVFFPRTSYNSGNKFGQRVWTESGHQGDVWWRGNVYVKQKEPFWVLTRSNCRSNLWNECLTLIISLPIVYVWILKRSRFKRKCSHWWYSHHPWALWLRPYSCTTTPYWQ